MPPRYATDFVKLRHNSSVCTPSNIVELQKSLDLGDLVSLVFLMCEIDQIEGMFEFLTSEDCTNMATLNLYNLLRTFPQWERKLPEALGTIKNNLALIKLNISPRDLQSYSKVKDSELCPVRVALYRIIESLCIRDGENLITKMVELGAPEPLTRFPPLEIYFMFCHLQGFFDIGTRENFEIFAELFKSIGKADLADVFTAPLVLLDNYVFDDQPLGVYQIKNPEKPGLCVIINQVRYGGKEADRKSSVVNAEDLRHLMGTLNFTVISMKDLTKQELCEKIKSTIVNSFSADHSIFMLIIMSHGDREGVICPPENLEFYEEGGNLSNKDVNSTNRLEDVVKIEDIQSSLFACKELQRIPKVLILNSCRGGFAFTTRNYFGMEADAADDGEIFSYSDIITCYSALPNFMSWRDSQKGSLFINVFCEILTKRPDIEICELFTLMNARLMTPTPDMSRAYEPLRNGYEKKMAMPFDWTSSLRKKLFLKIPKYSTCS